MQDLPHHYVVTAAATVDGDVALTSGQLPPLPSAPPIEFGGPGTRWSPETLLVGAVADCFILTFRAVASASNLTWTALACDVTGTLDRADRTMQFTRLDVHARLTVPPGIDDSQARRALEKAERSCLVTRSLKADVHMTIDVCVEAAIPRAVA